MTVIRPNSIAGINSITVQTGQALNVHDASGNLIRSLTNESGISTFSGINVGTAATIKSNGNATFSGIVTASSFVGDGSGLTGAGPSLTGSTNNTVVTVTGSNAIQGEANLTFDGTDLVVNGAGDKAIRWATGGTNKWSVYHNNSAGALVAYDNANSAERLRIDSSGRVGVGTVAPGQTLHLSAASGDVYNRVDTNVNGGMLLYVQGTQRAIFANDSAFSGTITDTGIGAKGNMIFRTGTSSYDERVRITGIGSIGINRTNPDQTVCVSGSAEFNAHDNTGGGDYYIAKGLIIGNAYDAGKAAKVSDDRNAIIWQERGLDLDFATSDTRRMTINYDGHIGLSPNGIDPSSTGGITVRQSANTDHGPVMSFNTIQSGQGFTEFRSSGTQVGSIGKSGTTGTVYNTSSDYRLKENAVTISDGIARLKTLKPYRFNFISEPDRTVDGFFAHEVTAVPEAITGTKDEVALADDNDKNLKKGDPIYQGIDQSKLVPLLTAALQEAVTKIETLETKVAALEGG